MLATASFAQSNSRVERGKRSMKDLNYVGAIEIFNAVLAKEDNAEAKINLAECYRKISDTENAEFIYGQVVRLPEVQPIHFLYYGEMLQRNGKCDLAKEWYAKFAQAVPEDVRGQYLNKACDYEQELKTKNEGIYEVKRASFNSTFDDFGSTFYKNGNTEGIIFASERDKGAAVKRNHAWTGNPFLDLYFVPVNGKGLEVQYGRVEKFSNDVNSKYHDAIITFSDKQDQAFFTRNNYSRGKTGKDDEGIMRLKIYNVKKKGNGWGSEEGLPFNSDEYSCAHPTLSVDGNKLYFASDMPGGFGGMDLYVSEYESGRWGPPTNLGPGINTEGHELFPYLTKTGRLYFSSDGNLGLGGLDIYFVDPKDGGQWEAPENLGAPMNSKDDDFGVTVAEDGKYGFFSSDRGGGSGRDDVYSFIKKAEPIQIYVYDATTKAPIDSALVTADTCSRKKLYTNVDGKTTLDLPFNTCCAFKAMKEGYEPNTMTGCVKDGSTAERAIVEIPLQKILKYNLEGVVFNQSTGLPLEGAKLTLLSPCKVDSGQTYVTDATGRYTFKLSKECCYKIKGEKDGFFAQTVGGDTTCTKGLTQDVNIIKRDVYLQPTTAGNPVATNPNGGDPIASTGGGNPIQPTNGSKTEPKKGGTNVVTTTEKPKTVYYDPALGQYIDPKTGKPASGTFGSTTYDNGKMDEKSSSTTFQHGSTYQDGAQGYLLHIYYDFDQSFLREESMPELDKLLKLMQDNPNYIIEIASHTDARGSDSYNNRLSQRRAEAVVRWLLTKGVERDRLVPRGYGENMLTNNCKNAIRCVEKDHQLNRRTEFRVLGCKGCTEQTAISRPKENPRVKGCKGCPF
jgi:outer membrane protein OmpA-like peptidoglycan-associated protein